MKNCQFASRALGGLLLLAGLLLSAPQALAQPTILSADPANMDTNVSPTAAMVLTFSEPMDTNATAAQFMDSTSIQMLDTDSAWNAADTVLTCTPVNPWPVGHLVVWMVEGAAPDGTPLGGASGGAFTAVASTPVSPSTQSPPASLAATMLTVTVNSGLPPFASGGTYQIFISPLGTGFNVLGPAGPLNSGSCSYWATATNGQATLADAVSETSAALTLTFASPTNGTIALTSASASQTGSFTLTVFAALNPPQLFLPAFSNGQFQCYLSGQPLCGYTVDTSGDLANWQPLLTLALSGWTTNFADTTGGGARFYRARYLAVLAEADYAISVAAVQALAKTQSDPLPPPDYTWQCDSSNEDAAITEYVKKLFWQENELVSQLLTAAHAVELLNAPESPDWRDVAHQLITQEMYPKVDTLFAWYSGGYEKFNAVAGAAFYTAKQDQMVMGSGAMQRPDWMDAITAWSLRVYEHLFDQLCNQDMYSKSFAIMKLVKWIDMLDPASAPSFTDVQDRLNKALTFKLSLDMSYTFSDWDSDGDLDDEASEEAKGDVNNLQAGVDAPYPVSTNSIPLVSGSWTDYEDNCSATLDPGQSIVWHISLGIQPCANNPQVILVLNGPVPAEETWTGCPSTSQDWVGLCWGLDFECHSGTQGGGGLFTYPLQDGVNEIVNDSFAGDDSSSPCSDPDQQSSGTLSINIEHTPRQ